MKKLVLLFALLVSVTACAKKAPVATPLSAPVTAADGAPEKKLVARALAVDVTQVQANKPFTIAWDHDGVDTDYYTFEVKTAAGVVLLNSGVPISNLVNGTASFTVGSLAKGDYLITVYAANDFFTSDPSVPLSVKVTPGKPKAPTNVRKVDGQ